MFCYVIDKKGNGNNYELINLISLDMDEKNIKKNDYQLKYILTWIMENGKKLTGNTIKKKSEQKARSSMDNENKIEAKNKELKRTNRNV